MWAKWHGWHLRNPHCTKFLLHSNSWIIMTKTPDGTISKYLLNAIKSNWLEFPFFTISEFVIVGRNKNWHHNQNSTMQFIHRLKANFKHFKQKWHICKLSSFTQRFLLSISLTKQTHVCGLFFRFCTPWRTQRNTKDKTRVSHNVKFLGVSSSTTKIAPVDT